MLQYDEKYPLIFFAYLRNFVLLGRNADVSENENRTTYAADVSLPVEVRRLWGGAVFVPFFNGFKYFYGE